MTGSSGNVNLFESGSEEYHKDEVSVTDLNLRLEKLNLGPKKKLLVLGLSGLLMDRVYRGGFQEIPKNRRPDGRYENFQFFKRPFAQDFIKFCLQRFEVGIWSSAMRHNVNEAVDFALEELKSKLLFVWNQAQCTDSGFKSLENNHKPLFFKELKKVRKEIRKGGPYSEANTLFSDDQPYKALLNPPNTAVFSKPYNAEDEDDEALNENQYYNPEGELGLYLKGLAEANDVQSYVKEHSFGQPAITSSHPDWTYYSVVLRLRSPRKN